MSENTTDFVVPEMETVKKRKTKQQTKQILEERPRLPRTNRTIPCAFCTTDKILNPDQYQALLDYWGNEEKIAREFMCKDCEVAMKDNPFKFWARHGDLLHALTRKLRAAFEVFNATNRGTSDVISLQNMVNSFLGEAFINNSLVEYITEPQPIPQNPRAFFVKALKIRNMPFIGTTTLQPYEPVNSRLKFE